MICPVKDFPSFVAQGDTDGSERIGVLATPSSPCVKKFDRVVISWEPCDGHAVSASITLYPGCAVFPILGIRSLISESLLVLVVSAIGTLWLVAPSEESREPLDEPFKLIDLVCNGLNIFRYTTHGDYLSHFLLVLIRILNLTFHPELELLFLKHVSWDVPGAHFLKLVAHLLFELAFQGVQSFFNGESLLK